MVEGVVRRAAFSLFKLIFEGDGQKLLCTFDLDVNAKSFSPVHVLARLGA